MIEPRILIAGIGNIFLGDDAFGVEAARRLAQRPLPKTVRVVDFGIRGLDLSFALLDGYDRVIFLDATPRGGEPGTLYVLEPEVAADSEPGDLMIEAHSMDPVKVLRFAAAMGGPIQQVLLIGCEPRRHHDDDEMEFQMDEAVRTAVDEAVSLTESIVARILSAEAEVGGESAGRAPPTHANATDGNDSRRNH